MAIVLAEMFNDVVSMGDETSGGCRRTPDSREKKHMVFHQVLNKIVDWTTAGNATEASQIPTLSKDISVNDNMPQNSNRNDQPHHNNGNRSGRILSHQSRCRQNKPHKHSSRIVEVLRLKLKESAKRREARCMAPKPNCGA